MNGATCRITFVMYRPGLAGGTRVTSRYAELLARRGHDVRVVCLAPRPTGGLARIRAALGFPPRFDVAAASPFLAQAGVQVIALPGPTPKARDFPDADVVIATFWPTAHWVAALPASKGRKFYFIQHHETHEYHDQALVEATYKLPLAKITISQWLRQIMASTYGDSSVPVIHNPVDLAQFFAPERTKQEQPTLGFMYSPRPFKGIGDCLAAVERVQEKIPNLRVVAFGSAPPSERLPLPACAEFVLQPEQTRIRELYARCDVWLCTSKVEGFALPPLEAMACRTPVVSTRVGAMPELVQEGESGFLVDVGDVEATADRTIRILEQSAADWQRMSARAYAVASSHTWDDAVREFEELLFPGA